MHFSKLLLIGLIFLPVHAFSQDKVGSSIVGGRTVDLLSDFTWRYRVEESTGDSCISISPEFDFCGVEQGWNRIGAASKEIAAQFRLDDRNYGLFVVEKLGYEDGMTLRYMRTAVIQNFAAAAGVSAEDIIVHSAEDSDFGNGKSTLLIYSGKWQGLTVLYFNTIISRPKRTFQLITYTIAETLKDHHHKTHRDFLSLVKFR